MNDAFEEVGAWHRKFVPSIDILRHYCVEFSEQTIHSFIPNQAFFDVAATRHLISLGQQASFVEEMILSGICIFQEMKASSVFAAIVFRYS